MKTAMVWGANGGIGRALVEALEGDGWQVFAVSRSAADGYGDQTIALEADVSKPWQVEQVSLTSAMESDRVHLWIYAVGDIASSRVSELDEATWVKILEANLAGAYRAVHFSLPLLAEDAHLVFLGAVSERLRLPGLSAYAAAKAGLEAFVEALSKEERKKRVTVVRPGAVATSLWEKVSLQMPKDSPPPEQVAAKILQAVEGGHKGHLDLTK